MNISIGDVFPERKDVGLQGVTAPTQPASIASEQSFLHQLRESRLSQQGESFDEMVQAIDAQADRLLKSPVPGEVAVYRELLQRFVKQVLDKSQRLEKRHDRRNRTLSIIRTIDETLAHFTEDLLAGQLDPLEILAAVNELRGLLMDLLI